MISRWMQDKRDGIREEIQGRINAPDRVDVHHTEVGTAADVRSTYRSHGVAGIAAGPGGGDPGAAAKIIEEGRASLSDDRAAAQAGRTNRVRASVDVQSEVHDGHNKGFFNDPELRK